MRINIAIDGPSAAGKSTISDLLAKKYHYAHLDTGAMYRSVAYKVIEEGIAFDDEESIASLISNISLEINSENRIYLDNVEITEKIRTNEISMAASTISKLLKVREALVTMQRKIASNKGYIVDGRDIGTVVLQDAEIKFYLTAVAKSRAIRRILQLNGENYSKEELLDLTNEIEKRDFQDMNREHSPLKKADDAIVIDTTNLNIEQTVGLMSKYIDEKLKK